MSKWIRVLSVASAVALTLPIVATVEGCSSTAAKKKKGAGPKSPAAAKTDGQKKGATATSKKDTGTNKGADLDGVKCDGTTEGIAFCSTETEITFCDGGTWYALDCGAALSGSFCAEDDSNVIDCFVADDVE
jgi:hypothetical protein